MIQHLNELAIQYPGVTAALGVLGFVLTVVFGIAAIYFYFNPRRPKYKLAYKLFFPNSVLARLSRRFKDIVAGRDSIDIYRYYVDIWNRGRETVTDDVLRGEFLISLQRDEEEGGPRIVGADVDSESHPSLSKFRTELTDRGARLTWRHFDPGMAVRVWVALDKQAPLSSVTVSAQGIGLDLQRVRSLSERGGYVEVVRALVVGGVPILIGSWGVGYVLQWATTLKLSPLIASLIALPWLVGSLLLFALVVAAGFALNAALEALFDLRSPIERREGGPAVDRDVADAVSKAYVSRLEPHELRRLALRSEMEGPEELMVAGLYEDGEPPH